MSDAAFSPDDGAAGCPSGLAPASRQDGADPSPFVRRVKGLNVLDLSVRGAKCGGCLSKIEKGVSALPGVSEARLNLSTGQMRVAWTGDLPARAVTDTIAGLGYGVAPFDPDGQDRSARREEAALLTAMAVAGFAAANIMLLSVSVWAGVDMGASTRTLMHWISAAIAVPAVLFSGRPFFASAFAVLKRGRTNMDVPISLALILALGISLWETAQGGDHAYFDAAAMLAFFLLIGRYLDARLRRRAHAAAHDLAALQARTVSRIGADGQVVSARAAEIAPGDRILIAAGERLAVDLDVVTGETDVDESLVTGESLPRRVGPGQRVYAGSIALSQGFEGRAVATAADSLLSDIARMLEVGEQRRSTYRRIADRAVSLYVPVVHSVALLTFTGWIIAGAGVREALFVAISTLIITCPCALALAAPVTQIVAASTLFRRGVFLKSGDALERLATADHVVFDKTGTLTLGTPRLDTAAIAPVTLARAARLARTSRHPLSRAIVAAAGPGPLAGDTREHPGLGVEGEVDGVSCRLGSAEWVGAADAAASGPALWFAAEGEPAVRFAFDDGLKPDAAGTIAGLTARGLTCEILSGDREPAVAAAAAHLGVETWTAGATPAAKVEWLEALRAQGRRTLMVGDGLNDAGALSLAHASLAPGGAMDVSQSASDAVFSGESLGALLTIIDASRRARATMLQNFGFAALYNVVAVPIAIAGYASPLVAAIAMSASSLIVTLNALRQAAPGPTAKEAA